ncbi:uncharacterized protein B0I36DRAFT_74974 [Microdochium trichocladiopsis]|uniref:Uncharacterized protein n=1 Tax=Microdochium trichocladiopsis TaxID=1682393 RepID=A0A9P8YF45_9PEZI|nr:uncharacterized protein B0I36DRAFT_74974 [Microdochium trichocladiopsis]KAH7038074.1 hypothetical protein B0I36DRAFT_74974 [Microdochium trichocladiopsis]
MIKSSRCIGTEQSESWATCDVTHFLAGWVCVLSLAAGGDRAACALTRVPRPSGDIPSKSISAHGHGAISCWRRPRATLARGGNRVVGAGLRTRLGLVVNGHCGRSARVVALLRVILGDDSQIGPPHASVLPGHSSRKARPGRVDVHTRNPWVQGTTVACPTTCRCRCRHMVLVLCESRHYMRI